jgi:hypothetical protein
MIVFCRFHQINIVQIFVILDEEVRNGVDVVLFTTDYCSYRKYLEGLQLFAVYHADNQFDTTQKLIVEIGKGMLTRKLILEPLSFFKVLHQNSPPELLHRKQLKHQTDQLLKVLAFVFRQSKQHLENAEVIKLHKFRIMLWYLAEEE